MRVLVTGATGFIGHHVINTILMYNKYEVIATSKDSVEDAKKFLWYKDVDYISLNLNKSEDNYFKVFKEPDTLIHLSWEGLPNFRDLYHIERNVISNYNFLKNIIKHGLINLNIIGTCLEYGLQEGRLSEDLQTKPVIAYALGKDTLRKFIEELNKSINFNFKWIRLFYMYGKGQSPKSILPQLNKAINNNNEVFNMSGGEQLRDYLPIEKVADFIIKISLQERVLGIINCCSGKPISIKKLVENHINKIGKSIKLNLGYYPYANYEPMSFWGDNSKLNTILDNWED